MSDRVPTPTNIVNHLDTGFGGPCSVVTAGFGPIRPPGLQFQWAWSRGLRGDADLLELADLQSLLSNFQLSLSRSG